MIPHWVTNNAMPARIIIHWTGGAYKASAIDREHYHILVEGDGTLQYGIYPISANNGPLTAGKYAAHCKGLNTRSIGVAVCCMGGAIEKPFNPGFAPLLPEQLTKLAEVVAYLCKFFSIPVEKMSVLSHGEVEEFYNIKQAGKWDVLVLPWNLNLSKKEVGDMFRSRVSRLVALGKEVDKRLEDQDETLEIDEEIKRLKVQVEHYRKLADVGRNFLRGISDGSYIHGAAIEAAIRHGLVIKTGLLEVTEEGRKEIDGT